MLKTIKTLVLASFVFAASAVTTGMLSQPAYAQNIQGNLCKGANDLKFSGAVADTADPSKQDETCASTTGTSASKLDTLIKNIVNIFSIIVGIVAVIMIIYGGSRYITSGGDSGNVGNAKNTILYAIIGLVIVALAQFIVRFVLNQSTNLTTP